MSKLFVFDMDGTLLNSKGKIQQATIEAVEKARSKNHKAIIATGRPFADAIKDLGNFTKYLDYIVCNNGTYYVDPKGQNFKYFGKVPKKLFKEVIEIGKKNNCVFTIHGSKEPKRMYLSNSIKNINWETPNLKKMKRMKDTFVSIDYILDWIKKQHISQISLRSDELTVKKMYEYFKKYQNIVNLHISDRVYLDINPKDISKITGIKKVAKKLGIRIKDIIAFGDSGNDLQMLEQVGLGICMENGHEWAKEVSDIIIGSHDTNSIGDKILEIINEK